MWPTVVMDDLQAERQLRGVRRPGGPQGGSADQRLSPPAFPAATLPTITSSPRPTHRPHPPSHLSLRQTQPGCLACHMALPNPSSLPVQAPSRLPAFEMSRGVSPVASSPNVCNGYTSAPVGLVWYSGTWLHICLSAATMPPVSVHLTPLTRIPTSSPLHSPPTRPVNLHAIYQLSCCTRSLIGWPGPAGTLKMPDYANRFFFNDYARGCG